MAESKLRELSTDFAVKIIRMCETIKGHIDSAASFVIIKGKKGCDKNGSQIKRESRNGSDGERWPEAHGRLLSLPPGADRGEQVYLQGISGADGRPGLQGLLPLHALLQGLKIFQKMKNSY